MENRCKKLQRKQTFSMNRAAVRDALFASWVRPPTGK
jgi:hypothetical protein